MLLMIPVQTLDSWVKAFTVALVRGFWALGNGGLDPDSWANSSHPMSPRVKRAERKLSQSHGTGSGSPGGHNRLRSKQKLRVLNN